MLKEVTENNYKTDVLESKGVVFVDFYAPWCGPCKQLAVIVEELSEYYDGKVGMYKADIEDNTSAVSDLSIQGVPFIAIYKDGEMKKKHVGLCSKKELKQYIEGVLNG